MSNNLLNLPKQLKNSFPRIMDYFGLWAILPDVIKSMYSSVKDMDLISHINSVPKAAYNDDRYFNTFPAEGQKGKRVAVVQVQGLLMKAETSLGDSTSTVRLRSVIRSLVKNPDVISIILNIDSPGGTVSGIQDLADEIQKAAEQKTVLAFIEDTGASAAYWIASQAHKIYTNSTALVGSIGVFSAVYDYSMQAAQMGIKVHLITTGDFKGAGTVGTEISPEQLEELQKVVNSFYDFFLFGVAKGRGLSLREIRPLADGRVWIGKEAQKVGLTDGVKTFKEVLKAASRSKISAQIDMKTDGKEEVIMNQKEKEAPVTATIEELERACPGASSDFVLAQVKAGSTVVEAQSAFIAAQQKQIEAQEKAQAEAQKQKRSLGFDPVSCLPGKPVGRKTLDEADPILAFKHLQGEFKKQGMSTSEANRAIALDYPDVHKSFVVALNQKIHEGKE